MPRIALVTGAAQGIGAAVARLLAAKGARVALVDRNADAAAALAREIGGVALGADVSSAADVDAAFTEAERALDGHVEWLVNSAGITQDDWLWRLSEDQWDAVMNVNLKGSFLTTQRFARALMAAEADQMGEPLPGGAVVNISSIVGKSGNMGQANYAASKAGVIGLTKSAAKDLARHGVRVNAILPGFVRTPMSAAVPQAVIDKMVAQVPLREMGEPSDVAHAAHFLLSREARYVTGATLEVSGGLWM